MCRKANGRARLGIVYDDLMTASADEIDGLYGLIAESVEYPEDKRWAIFTLREEAVYHDGMPIIAADFVHAFETIKQHGRPFIQSFYEDVLSAEALSDKRLKFTFASRDSNETDNHCRRVVTTAATLLERQRCYRLHPDAAAVERPVPGFGHRPRPVDLPISGLRTIGQASCRSNAG